MRQGWPRFWRQEKRRWGRKSGRRDRGLGGEGNKDKPFSGRDQRIRMAAIGKGRGRTEGERGFLSISYLIQIASTTMSPITMSHVDGAGPCGESMNE